MKLPKELTQVTPFSKAFALVLFVILPVLTFLVGAMIEQNQFDNLVVTTARLANSANSSSQNVTVYEDFIKVDFGMCNKTRDKVYLSLGTATFDVKGSNGDACNFDYQISNDVNADYRPNYSCSVPTKFGLVTFPQSTTTGLDLSLIKANCQKL